MAHTKTPNRLSLAPRDFAEETRPEIRFPQGPINIHRLTNKLAEALRTVQEQPPYMFLTSGGPVRVVKRDGRKVVETLTEDRMRAEAARHVDWVLVSKNSAQPASPPRDVIKNFLALNCPGFPRLRRLVHVPVFGKAGKLIMRPGYDHGTGVYHATTLDLPSIDDDPSSADIECAKNIIFDELLVDFPFDGPGDGESEQAHALALMLLPFVRDAIDGPTPLHLVRKPPKDEGGPGTGGTLLVQLCLYPALGKYVAGMPDCNWNSEWTRRLTSVLLGHPEAIFIDNVNSLEDESLCSALTSETWQDRVLGKSDAPELPVRCVWAASGNAPVISGEMLRRSVRIQLDAKMPHPAARTGFRHPNVKDWVRENRPLLVWACLTLVQRWIACGRPRWRGRPMGMYEGWSEVIGGILEACEVPGFLENTEDFQNQAGQSSPESEFLEAVRQKFGGDRFQVSQVREIAEEVGLISIGGSNKSMGKLLMGLTGRKTSGGLSLETSVGHKKMRVYWIVSEGIRR